ncbi:MAG TPA: serine/threonine-protein kinase [Terriglobales bacterium]|nr:serine/threonine-protein kinase [Terriglobales bacterium]
MNSERWQRVKQLLEQAIALDADDRAAFLDRACVGDTELRREVDSLLSSHDQAGTGFLKNPAVNLKAAAAESTTRAGRRIGVYQIVEEIGHGGMGDVYRAIRADGQYTKEVAVKLVRGGFDSAAVQERFRNERQILASLDHPNIARLLDGGSTDDGVPYLVMELIEGTRIDSYCDEHKLSITDRLRLFRSVCAAVQFAHQRLVIHRDIKPGNILVTQEGAPKLLDFGIAKILDPAASGDETVTIARALTPEYASPEQIRGEPITTASDVYSLGVVLYQLLTGRSPYPGETRTSLEIARAVCDTDPGRPSTAVLKPQTIRTGEHVEQIAPDLISSSREGTPAKLQRRLAGDLDNIVLMALRKEPNRRYPSAEQFSEDIRRHLEALPVTATKGSWKYRAGKFGLRHKASVAASAVVVLALVAGVGATVRAARIARQQAEIARSERVRAEKRFNDVRKLANSLIFEIHDSIQDLPGATPSRKLLLDRAVEYLDKLDQDATGDADLQRELATGYQRLAAVQGDTSQSNLGEISAAEVSIRKSIGLFEAVARANPHNVTDQLNLAMAYRRRAFTDIFEKNGREEIDQALKITEPLMQSDGAKVEVRNERALELQILANVQDATGERLKAIDTFRQHLTLRQDIERTNPDYKGIHQGVVHATIQLAFQIGRFGNKDEALDLLNHGIAQYEAMANESKNQDVARNLAASVVRRGMVYLMRGDTAAALADIRSARETTARLAKRDPKNAMLQSDMCDFDFEEGRALTASGKPAAGLALLQKSSVCYRDLHLEADTGPGIGLMESWIAEALTDLHKLPEALQHYQAAAKALATDVEKYDDARCDLAMVHTKIGDTLWAMGKTSEASAEYTLALDTAKLDFSRQRNDYPALNAAADAYAGLGDVAALQARNARDSTARIRLSTEARAKYEKSRSVWKEIPNPSSINGSGYRTEEPKDVTQRLAQRSSH